MNQEEYLSKEEIHLFKKLNMIKNSDLTQQNNKDWTPLMFSLYYNRSQNLKLSSKQFKTIYGFLNKEQKQTTFQKLIHENVEDDHQYFII